MAQGKENKVTTAGVVFASNGSSPVTTGSGIPVVAVGTPLAKTAKVSGLVPGTSVVIVNPA